MGDNAMKRVVKMHNMLNENEILQEKLFLLYLLIIKVYIYKLDKIYGGDVCA